MWKKVYGQGCKVRIPSSSAENPKYWNNTPKNRERVKREMKKMGLPVPKSIPRERCAYKLQQHRTGMCLAMFTEKGKQYSKQYHFGEDWKHMRTHMIVGVSDCSNQNVYWFREAEDIGFKLGHTGKVTPGMTVQQKYQMQLLSKFAQDNAKYMTVTDKTADKKARDKASDEFKKAGPNSKGLSRAAWQRAKLTKGSDMKFDGYDVNGDGYVSKKEYLKGKTRAVAATLEQKDLLFYFREGDRVRSSDNFDKCKVGVVKWCGPSITASNPANFVCQVLFGSNQHKQVSVEKLSPADLDWPNQKQILKNGEDKQATAAQKMLDRKKL
jgi:hypothetical protein